MTVSNAQKQMVRQVSRTFALSIEQLPSRLQEAVGVAYLLLRVSDLLEDHPTLPASRKVELLHLWAHILDGQAPVRELTASLTPLDGSDPEVAVAQRADVVLQMLTNLPYDAQEIIVRHVHASTVGMARWQQHGPFVEDEAALDDYMHEVAGRVGFLVTELFVWRYPALEPKRESLMALGRECGLALQTVNVIRGMRKDYERGWVFVPVDLYQQAGLTRDSLFDPANLSRSLQVVEALADKADRHLRNGLAYILAYPSHYHGLRLALMWPFYFAVRTLAVSRSNASVIQSEAKISRDEVQRIVILTRLFGWSNPWVRWYYQKLKGREPALAPTVAQSDSLSPGRDLRYAAHAARQGVSGDD